MSQPTITTYTDDFTAGSGDLAGSSTSGGALSWSDVVGALTRGSGGLTGAAGSISVVDAAWPDVTETVPADISAQQVLYARVQDANSWWRASIKAVTRVISTTTYVNQAFTFVGQVSGYEGIIASTAGPGPYYLDYVTTTRDGNVPLTRLDGPYYTGSSYYFKKNTRQVQSSSTTATFYSAVLEKCVAGTVSTVATSSENAGAPSVLALSAVEDVLTATLTAGSSTLTASGTDSFLNAVTQHGVGPSDKSWSLTLVGSASPPTIVSPLNNSDVDASAVTITIESNLPPADPATSGDGQWRQAGATDWTAATDVFGAGTEWAFDTTGLTMPVEIEAQARQTDQHGNTTGWSPSVFFTLRTAPTVPGFVSPASGSDVVASDIATVDFETDGVASTARQARRVADNVGAADPNNIYQVALTLTGPDGNGYYLLTGDGSIHPTGPEHIQVRRQTAAGGTVWSAWADLPVTMALAAPYAPLVGVTKLTADAALRFDVTAGGSADADHTDTVRFDFRRYNAAQATYERVASVGVTDGKASWTDLGAPVAGDYRVDAVASNGAITSWGVES